jgi:ADP-heptose:LPS heptosyltransferase
MRTVEIRLKQLLLRLIGSFRSGSQYAYSQLPVGLFKRIVIIRQHDQLGDLLIATPAIRAVRRRFPEAFIAVVAREYTAPILSHNPHIDEVIVFYEKLWRWNFRRAATFWKSLRGRFDCAVVLNTISRSTSSDLIALLSGAKFIVGPDHLSLGGTDQELIYNVVVPRSPLEKHEIERNLDIVRSLGADENDLEYDLVLTDEEVHRAEKIYQSLSIPRGRKVVGVHFGALNPSKCFPLEKLAEVIDWMVEQFNSEIVLIIGPNEIARREFLISRLRHTVHSAPLMPLRIMAALMRHCCIILCNDTGTLHIAASQSIPTVSFHSVSDPTIWKPPHPRHIAVRADDSRVDSITVAQVQTAVREAMTKFVKESNS